MATTFIYALCEPGTRTVRYIGKSNTPEKRLKNHLSTSSRAANHLGCWLRSLGKFSPVLVVLREVSLVDWQREEERYIRIASALGMALVNGTGGGDGCNKPTPETRARMSAVAKGRRPSDAAIEASRAPEVLARRSARLRGIRPSEATLCAAQTPEVRARRRATMTGVRYSPERRRNNSLAQIGIRKGVKQTPEHVANRVASRARNKARKNPPTVCAPIS